ncbi:MAG TPA: cupin domain-containing protein [Rhodocyclaceae bacterium]
MQVKKLSDMRGGWFVGRFEPTCLALNQCEVAVKKYAAGDAEPRHVHRIAEELTLVVSGRVILNDVELGPGDIACLNPGEPASFSVIEDAVTVVVKSPSVPSDKYPA